MVFLNSSNSPSSSVNLSPNKSSLNVAAVSALFIVCNSAAGLIGGKPVNYMLNQSSFIWFAAAVTGGIIGAYMGSKKYPQKAVQYVLASVLIIASAKLILFT